MRLFMICAVMAASPAFADASATARNLGVSVCGSALSGSGPFAGGEPLAEIVAEAGAAPEAFCACVGDSFASSPEDATNRALSEMIEGRWEAAVGMMATARAGCLSEEIDEGSPDMEACLQILSGDIPVTGVNASVLRSRGRVAGYDEASLCGCAASGLAGVENDAASSGDPSSAWAGAIVTAIGSCIPSGQEAEDGL